MKLNFGLHKKVNLGIETVLTDITRNLKEMDYSIKELTPNSVIFQQNVFSSRMASKSDYYTKVDDGKIDLIQINQAITVNLSYRVSILQEFFFLLLIFLGGITIDFKIMLLSIGIVINFLIKYNYLRTHILIDILNQHFTDIGPPL